MKVKERLKQDFSQAAEWYDDHALIQKKVVNHLLDVSLKHLPNDNVNCLDAGCGTGFLRQLMKKKEQCKQWNMVECDLALGMCQYTANKFGNSESVVNGNIESLPFKDQSFNAVYSSMVLQWSGDIGRAISELYRVVDMGSCIFASIVSSNSLNQLDKTLNKVTGHRHVHSFFAAQELQDILENYGIKHYVLEEMSFTEHYPDVLAIMQYLKGIGARYKPKKTQYTPNKSFLTEAEKLYSTKYRTSKGLPLTWNIITLIIEKK